MCFSWLSRCASNETCSTKHKLTWRQRLYCLYNVEENWTDCGSRRGKRPPSAVSLQWLQQLFHFQGEWGLNSCKLAQKLSFSLRSFLQVSSKTFFTTMNIYCPKKLWAGRIIWGPHRFVYVCFATHWGQDLPHDKWSLALYLTSHLSFSNHIFHYELQFTGNFNTVSVTKCVCGTVHQIPKVGIKCLL